MIYAINTNHRDGVISRSNNSNNIRILRTHCFRFLRHCKKYKKYGLLFHLKIVKCIPAILRASLLKFNIINLKFFACMFYITEQNKSFAGISKVLQ